MLQWIDAFDGVTRNTFAIFVVVLVATAQAFLDVFVLAIIAQAGIFIEIHFCFLAHLSCSFFIWTFAAAAFIVPFLRERAWRLRLWIWTNTLALGFAPNERSLTNLAFSALTSTAPWVPIPATRARLRLRANAVTCIGIEF